MIQSP